MKQCNRGWKNKKFQKDTWVKFGPFSTEQTLTNFIDLAGCLGGNNTHIYKRPNRNYNQYNAVKIFN